MPIAQVVTLVWLAIALLTLGLIKYYKIALPQISQRTNLSILILEILAIAIAIYFNDGVIPSPYILIASVFLFFIGWIKSNQNLLLRFFRGEKKRPWLWRINSVFEGTLYSQNIYFMGDWFQIVAIGLVWASSYSLFISCFIYPIAVYIFSSRNAREVRENTAWRNFIKNLLQIIIRVLLALTLFAVIRRDMPIFFGTRQDAINLIDTLAQVEATVFALVITFLFVLVEFTNATYSPRLVKSFVNQWSSKLMVGLALISISSKFLLLANTGRFVQLPQTSNGNLLIDFTLLLTFMSVVGYAKFIHDVLEFMLPETTAKQILNSFDNNWMEKVREIWSDKNRFVRRNYSFEDDPMIPFERFLATTIERGDIYSLKVSLVLLRDKVSRIMSEDDGALIDEYLYNRIGNIIDVLADKHLDFGLEIFCEVIDEITRPSVNVLKNSETGMLGVPPGAQLLRSIADRAIDHGLLDSGRKAIYHLDKRCEAAIKALPAYSELWLMNPENLENENIDKDKLWKNDRQLEGVLFGYLAFFEKLGIKAIKKETRELAWSVSHVISSQILNIADAISEEAYQRELILNCIWRLEELVKTSCEKKFPGAVSFGILSFGINKVNNEPTALILSASFSKFMQLMAKAEILDSNHIRDIAVMTVYLADKYPQASISTLNGLGIAGESFKKAKSDTRQENLNYVLAEILTRIDQVEKAGLSKAEKNIKSEISLAAKTARKKSKQIAVRKSRKVTTK